MNASLMALLEPRWWWLVLLIALGISLATLVSEGTRRLLGRFESEFIWALLAFLLLLLFTLTAHWAFRGV